MEIVGLGAAGLLALVVGYQLALAAGAPWGAAAYGGRVVRDDGRLPRPYRAVSGVTAGVLVLAAWLVLAAGSVVGPEPLSEDAARRGAWLLAALFVLNTVGNVAARHPVERWGLGGVTAVLAVLCAALAIG